MNYSLHSLVMTSECSWDFHTHTHILHMFAIAAEEKQDLVICVPQYSTALSDADDFQHAFEVELSTERS